MSKLNGKASSDPTFAEFNSPATVEMKQLIAKLEQSHDLLYKTINLETWALAETMDYFLPGFWSRFLENRRISVKQLIEKRRAEKL